MKGYLQTVITLLALSLATEACAQGRALQSAEHLHKETLAANPTRDGHLLLLDGAFDAMYDLDFNKADSEIAQFVRESPGDPMGPAARAASVVFSIFDQYNIMQSQFFTSDELFTKRQAATLDAGSLGKFESADVRNRSPVLRPASDLCGGTQTSHKESLSPRPQWNVEQFRHSSP